MRATFILMVLLGCAERRMVAPIHRPQAPCVTSCDMVADLGEGDCAALNAAAARSVQLLEKDVRDFRPGYASCVALSGWKVIIHSKVAADGACHDRDAWVDRELTSENKCVLGVTRWPAMEIELENAAFSFNSLTHEVAHVLDKAFGFNRGMHCDWTQRGVKQAILEATGEADQSSEECD